MQRKRWYSLDVSQAACFSSQGQRGAKALYLALAGATPKIKRNGGDKTGRKTQSRGRRKMAAGVFTGFKGIFC